MNKNNFGLLFLVNLIVILPIIYLSIYNYPSSDDFSYAIDSHKDFMERQIWHYNNWGSRYMATAFLITSPLNFGSDQYFGLYTFAFIMLFYFANHRILKDVGMEDKRKRFVVNLSIISVYTLLQTSLVENYFWLAGSATYFLPSILFIFYISCLKRIFSHQKVLLNSFFAINSMLIIGGCSELLVGFSGIITGILFIFYFIKNKKINYSYIILILLIIGLFLFVALGPGNELRGQIKKAELSLMDVAFMSFNKVIVINIRYLVVGFILFVLLFKTLNVRLTINNKIKHPIYIFVFYNFLLFIGSFITIYKLTYYYPPRVENLLLFVSLIFIFLLSYIFYERYFVNLKNIYYFISGVAVCLVYFCVPKNSFQRESNLQLLYSDIFNSRAKEYVEQINERKQLIKHCDECTVPAIKNAPRTILFKDITSDKHHYINTSVAHFYQIKSIKTDE